MPAARVIPRASKRLASLLVSAASLLLFATGCSLLGDSLEVGIVLPPPPPQWKPIFRAEGRRIFLVRAPGRGREVQEQVVDAPEGEALPSCRVRLPKRTNLPVVAFPVVGGRSDLLKPAGALFPAAVIDGDRLVLSYRDGFAALLLSRLVEHGELVDALNTERLQAEIQRRSGGDPWLIDGEAMLSLLAYGSFRADRIAKLPAYTVTLHCGSGSRWVEGDPFRPEIQADGEGSLTLEGVVPGFHSLFRMEDAAGEGGAAGAAVAPTALERIDLLVSEEEWIARDALTGAAESGRW